MKKISSLKTGLMMLAALGFTFSASATTYTATTSGSFSSSATWLGGSMPAVNLIAADNIIINSGVNVNLDVDVLINNASAALAVNGTLSGTHNLTMQNGVLSGAGTIDIHDLTFASTGASTFTGSLTAAAVYNSSAALSFAGNTHITDTLGLYLGAVSTAIGDTLTFGSNAVIHVIAGTYTTTSGTITQLGNVNLVYTGTGTVTTSGEVTLSNINNVTVNLASNANQLNLSNNLTVNGLLSVQSGSLNINGRNLTLNGTVNTSATGTLSGNATSNLALGGSGNMGTLTFTSGSNNLGNLTVNGASSSNATLASDLTVSGVLTLTSGRIDLSGSSSLILTGLDTIHSASSASYVSTSGTGSLTANIMGGLISNSRLLPVGTSAFYAPVRITNNALIASNFSANAHPGVFANGTTGADLSTGNSAVNTSWNVSSDVTTGANVTIEAFWSTAMETNSFVRSDVRLSHYINSAWDDSAHVQATVHAGGMASVTRSGITSFSPFAVFSGQPTGINDVKANTAFNTYPNPAINTVTITVADPKNNDEVKVYDMIGNHIGTYAIYANNKIDVSSLTTGVYFLSVNNSSTQRFVKQ